MPKAMKNPTREQTEFWLLTSPSKYMSDSDNHTARRLVQAYLRALDMRDEIEDGHLCLSECNVCDALKKFEEGQTR